MYSPKEVSEKVNMAYGTVKSVIADTSGDDLRPMLKTMAMMHGYSAASAVLAYTQADNITFVAGEKYWNDHGRSVTGDGITILKPSGYILHLQTEQKDEYGDVVRGDDLLPLIIKNDIVKFVDVPATVYDFSQTKPLENTIIRPHFLQGQTVSDGIIADAVNAATDFHPEESVHGRDALILAMEKYLESRGEVERRCTITAVAMYYGYDMCDYQLAGSLTELSMGSVQQDIDDIIRAANRFINGRIRSSEYQAEIYRSISDGKYTATADGSVDIDCIHVENANGTPVGSLALYDMYSELTPEFSAQCIQSVREHKIDEEKKKTEREKQEKRERDREAIRQSIPADKRPDKILPEGSTPDDLKTFLQNLKSAADGYKIHTIGQSQEKKEG